tara:strand:+ start:880 stop:1020 length:141 start_codon:yes stop_codon:yes gene_type:complete
MIYDGYDGDEGYLDMDKRIKDIKKHDIKKIVITNTDDLYEYYRKHY